jgi:lysophospholipase L1-like esterase
MKPTWTSAGVGHERVTRRGWLRLGSAALLGAGMAGGVHSLRELRAGESTQEKQGPSEQEKDLHPEEFRKMVSLGDSITAGGWSTSPDRCWVSLLTRLINDFQTRPMECVNAGIGANVISTRSPVYPRSGRPAANERIAKHVIAHHPDLLTIAYGCNDARGGTPLPLFREELAGLVRSVRKHVSPLIVLLGPYYMADFKIDTADWHHADLSVFRRFNETVAQVARQEACLYVDVLAAMGDTDWMVHYDRVHTNDLGHRIIANRTFEVLAQRCSGLAKKTKELERTSPRWRNESALQADYGY